MSLDKVKYQLFNVASLEEAHWNLKRKMSLEP